MKAKLFIVAATLNTIAALTSTVRADDGSMTLAACRRVVSYCPPTTTVYPSTHVQNDVTNNYHENTVNVYSSPKPGAIVSSVSSPQGRATYTTKPLTAGRTYTLKMNYLEDKPGDVTLFFGSTSQNCTVKRWSPCSVTFVVPNMGVAQAGTLAVLRVTRPDGVGFGRMVRLLNPEELVEHEDPNPDSMDGQIGMLQNANEMTLNPANGG